jgi:hypothetical protein
MAKKTENEQTTETPVAAAALRPKQNGVGRPAAGTATGRVWAIFDEISKAEQRPAKRSEVMAAGKAEGLNEATIATQYGRAMKFYGIQRVKEAAASEDAPAVQPAA